MFKRSLLTNQSFNDLMTLMNFNISEHQSVTRR